MTDFILILNKRKEYYKMAKFNAFFRQIIDPIKEAKMLREAEEDEMGNDDDVVDKFGYKDEAVLAELDLALTNIEVQPPTKNKNGFINVDVIDGYNGMGKELLFTYVGKLLKVPLSIITIPSKTVSGEPNIGLGFGIKDDTGTSASQMAAKYMNPEIATVLTSNNTVSKMFHKHVQTPFNEMLAVSTPDIRPDESGEATILSVEDIIIEAEKIIKSVKKSLDSADAGAAELFATIQARIMANAPKWKVKELDDVKDEEGYKADAEGEVGSPDDLSDLEQDF
jgi:hypothetical protein